MFYIPRAIFITVLYSHCLLFMSSIGILLLMTHQATLPLSLTTSYLESFFALIEIPHSQLGSTCTSIQSLGSDFNLCATDALAKKTLARPPSGLANSKGDVLLERDSSSEANLTNRSFSLSL